MKNQNSRKTEDNSRSAGVFLRFLYRSVPGRVLLKLLCSRTCSVIVGKFMDSPLSKPLIKPFVKNAGIDLSLYESDNFKCFNDCFTRKIKDGNRPFSNVPSDFCSPCDGLLTAYKIQKDTVIPVKQSSYTVSSLLGGDAVCEKFVDGICLVIRLCVDNYHRYSYFDGGKTLSPGKFIPGKLHTVRPVALENVSVFTENCREYTVIETENFKTAVYVEVGAMLVGKIKNLPRTSFLRGDEKGMFLYGGSTVIVLLEKDSVSIRNEYFSSHEIPVKMGEKLN